MEFFQKEKNQAGCITLRILKKMFKQSTKTYVRISGPIDPCGPNVLAPQSDIDQVSESLFIKANTTAEEGEHLKPKNHKPKKNTQNKGKYIIIIDDTKI